MDNRNRAILVVPVFLITMVLHGGAQVGRPPDGTVVAPTLQTLRPAGSWVDISGRPRDQVLSPDGRFLYVKNLSKRNRLNLTVIDVRERKIIQSLDDPEEAHSYHGIALTKDGHRLYTSVDEGGVWEADVAQDGRIAWSRKIAVSARPDKTYPGAGGIALDEANRRGYVCVSRTNSLAVIDLVAGKEISSIRVGVAPYSVVLDLAAHRAFVSNWGGSEPKEGERQGDALGVSVEVDEEGIASSGTVSIVDLDTQKEMAQIETGLHPTEMAFDTEKKLLYVANANEDNVSVIDTQKLQVIETIPVRLDERQPFGSAPNAVALSPDGRTLYVANGGNNALAVIQLGRNARQGNDASRVAGFIPTAWYPADVILRDNRLFVANLKGWGSLDRPQGQKAFHVRDVLGTVTMVDVPDPAALAAYTRQVHQDAQLPQILRGLEKATSKTAPVPLPARTGDPSVFEHVVFVIKENRTYDQILGDIGKGDSDPSLCIFPRDVTPNHHALAEEFVLLDNFYCNSLYSADGHAWITEANTTDYLEKSRSNLVWGNNPLSYSSSGFLWTHFLNHGLTFENFGEFDWAGHEPDTVTFMELYRGWLRGKLPARLTQKVEIAALRPYTVKDFPGWNMNIPDVIRADAFIRRLKEHEKKGSFPNFTILYLPNDHTSGTKENMPTPRAYLAQNDLELGRCIEALTKSRFWPKTCVFVVEDDPQDGFDHVDGHRSVAFVISPYTKRRALVSTRYNQTGMLRSMELILGVGPMTQFDAMSNPMFEVFQEKEDLRPYRVKKPRVRLDELNPPKRALAGKELYWAQKSEEQNFDEVDRADEETLNRIIWHSVRGVDTPYPEIFTNAHRARKMK